MLLHRVCLYVATGHAWRAWCGCDKPFFCVLTRKALQYTRASPPQTVKLERVARLITINHHTPLARTVTTQQCVTLLSRYEPCLVMNDAA